MSDRRTGFGRYLRKLRAERDERLQDMAEQLRVSPAYLSAIERGLRNIPEHWLDQLCEVYGLSHSERTHLASLIRTSRVINYIRVADMSHEDRYLFDACVTAFVDAVDEERDQWRDVLRQMLGGRDA